MVIAPVNLDKLVAKGDYQRMNTTLKQDSSMTMNSEKRAERLKLLQLTHLELDTKIKRMETNHADDLIVRDLKKKKLRLKEQIENIKRTYEI